ncbi:hypothetical protein HELRODRAFT_153221, partial [Helobdella robusta]|uniref:PDZ domain-containing protein n=1 Tax=Helobdella robusta TaxID=6412 RepID=T1EL13_HELRO
VTLNLSDGKALGMTVVGHAEDKRDIGLFVGTVKKGCTAHLSGKVQPGDLIVSVNGLDLTKLDNEEALEVLRQQVFTSKYLNLVLEKYW